MKPPTRQTNTPLSEGDRRPNMQKNPESGTKIPPIARKKAPDGSLSTFWDAFYYVSRVLRAVEVNNTSHHHHVSEGHRWPNMAHVHSAKWRKLAILPIPVKFGDVLSKYKMPKSCHNGALLHFSHPLALSKLGAATQKNWRLTLRHF